MAFAPGVEDIYPGGVENRARREFDLGTVAEVMEGKFRPGHFQGVAEVVSRLLRLVRPDRAYFGEKDFQQIAVIRRMTETEGIDVDIIACPIRRADDGLALSAVTPCSPPEQRAIAPEIHRALAGEALTTPAPIRYGPPTTQWSSRSKAFPARVEYFEIVDGRTLLPVEEWEESPWIVGCITVYCGDIRLIDNIAYKK